MSGGGARAPGTLIANNRYKIVKFLGRGAYGEVYEVYDHHQNQQVALKFLNPGNPMPWAEAQRLTALRSEYILPILNADSDAGVPFLVTEIAQHGSTEERMPPPGVPPAQAVRWVQHACRGTSRAHQARIVHRDIKPANLFLTAEGEAVLGDFGIAWPMDPNGMAPAVGTPVTVAPEGTPGGQGPRPFLMSTPWERRSMRFSQGGTPTTVRILPPSTEW